MVNEKHEEHCPQGKTWKKNEKKFSPVADVIDAVIADDVVTADAVTVGDAVTAGDVDDVDLPDKNNNKNH